MKRGAQVVCFNLSGARPGRFQHPQNALEMLTNGSSPLNTAFFRPALGGDMAAIRGIAKFLLAWEREAQAEGSEPVFDHAFIADTDGLEAYLAELDATLGTPGAPVRAEPGGNRAGCADVPAGEQGHRLLGDGHHTIRWRSSEITRNSCAATWAARAPSLPVRGTATFR